MEQKNEMKWTILKSSAQSLSECLHCYTKSQLLEIASFYGLDGSQYRKSELAEKLCFEILDQMPAVLKYSSFEDLNGLKVLLNEPEGAESQGVWTYQKRGWLYVFGEHGDRTFVVPGEVKEKIIRFLSNEKNREKVVHNQELYRCARALTHLYGVYEKKQLMNLWEDLHSVPLKKGELSRFLKFTEKTYGEYRVEGRYVISRKIPDTRFCLELMNEVKNLPYYMPDEEEICLYSEEYVDVEAPEYKSLRSFLEKRKHNPLSFAELMTGLEDNLLLGGGVSKAFYLMKEAGIYLNGEKEQEEFLHCYAQWERCTRQWKYRGFTPEEIMEE
ncbi:hypothetical protein [Anaerostipes sp.]|uniref:hypothetical protein n=1 Tax=Anaerostipes sp. TaxID=1872530 RepID=UPI0025BA4809|nr:hypothetical protein [Anaerostipes sp.]